jgi:hypothetical protein
MASALRWLDLYEKAGNDIAQLTSFLREKRATARSARERRIAQRQYNEIMENIKRLETDLDMAEMNSDSSNMYVDKSLSLYLSVSLSLCLSVSLPVLSASLPCLSVFLPCHTLSLVCLFLTSLILSSHSQFVYIHLSYLYVCSNSGAGELNNRRGMVQQLKNSAQYLTGLLGDGVQKRSRRRKQKYEDTEETQHMSNQQLLQQQVDRQQEHDEQLDYILDGVGKLKDMSYDINRELDETSGLIDDVDEKMDTADTQLLSNIRRIDDVSEKSGGCVSLCVIIILLVGILALLIL